MSFQRHSRPRLVNADAGLSVARADPLSAMARPTWDVVRRCTLPECRDKAGEQHYSGEVVMSFQTEAEAVAFAERPWGLV